MFRFILRRLLILPLILILVNATAFIYAQLSAQAQQASSPWGAARQQPPPVLENYQAYLNQVLEGNLGEMPLVNESVTSIALPALGKSLGLLGIAVGISVTLGFVLGLAAAKANPPSVRTWLMPLVTLGLAMPGFFIGIVLTMILLSPALKTQSGTFLPVAGFGWDAHLILPVLALSFRPTMQIALVTANIFKEEYFLRYVTMERAFGNTWHAIRWRKVMKNALAPILATIASAFRLSVAELILVEWLFNWRGVGSLLVQTLVPPNISSPWSVSGSHAYFLHPPLLAFLMVVFALLFLLTDLFTSALARAADPRLSVTEDKGAVYG